MKNKLAPIVIFVYSRPEHTKKLIESLLLNKEIQNCDIYIYSDAAKNVKTVNKVSAVRKYLNELEENKTFKNLKVIYSQKNKGLAKSVIEGVSEVINKYGKVIVLEDDLIVAKNFIQYMNEALDFYKDNEKIWSISGYNLPIKISEDYKEEIYLSYRACSWSWATWKDKWEKVDWEVEDYKKFKNNFIKRMKFNRGGNDMSQMLDSQMQGRCDSWAIRWCYQQCKENMYTIYPVKSLVKNIGLDGSGTHSGNTTAYTVEINENQIVFNNNIKLDKKITKEFKDMFYGGPKQTIIEILSILGLYELIYKMRHKK